jgi:hypothetical protein
MSTTMLDDFAPSGIIFPLIVPVVVHLTSDTELYVKTIAAAFSSTVFGNLCSPIADTTIASALFTSKYLNTEVIVWQCWHCDWASYEFYNAHLLTSFFLPHALCSWVCFKSRRNETGSTSHSHSHNTTLRLPLGGPPQSDEHFLRTYSSSQSAVRGPVGRCEPLPFLRVLHRLPASCGPSLRDVRQASGSQISVSSFVW